jgi:hypothetical protein
MEAFMCAFEAEWYKGCVICLTFIIHAALTKQAAGSKATHIHTNIHTPSRHFHQLRILQTITRKSKSCYNSYVTRSYPNLLIH